MKARITRQNLQKLPVTPPSKPKKWLWDTEIPCFGAYRSSDGRVSFVYQYRMPGEREIRSKFLGYGGEISLEQARGLAAEMAFQRRQGIDPVLEERRKAAEEKARIDLILGNYAAAYLQRRIDANKPLNKAQTRIIERDIVGNLGHLRIDRMTVDHVEEFAKKMGERAESARRMGLVYLKSILNDAKHRGRITISPALEVETPKAGKRVRRLSEREIKRYYEAIRDIGDVRSDALETLLRVSKRKEEVAEMTWEELDLPKGVWMLPADRTKPDEAFLIDLPRQVIEIIRRQQPDPKKRHGPVFTLNGRTPCELGSQVKDVIDANMHRRIELAEGAYGPADRVAHYTVHDTRKVGISTLQERPFLITKDLLDVILLHKGNAQVVDSYALSKLEIEAGEALQQWNDWLDELLSGDDVFPGGRELPRLAQVEVEDRIADFRRGWPERAHQKAAREKRAARKPTGGNPRGRAARSEDRRRAREKAREEARGEAGRESRPT